MKKTITVLCLLLYCLTGCRADPPEPPPETPEPESSPQDTASGSSAWFWILLLGLVNTGGGCYLYFSPLSKLPVQTVAVCGYLEPMSAVVFAALLLGERMTPVQILGAVCIIGGAMIGELVKRPKL